MRDLKPSAGRVVHFDVSVLRSILTLGVPSGHTVADKREVAPSPACLIIPPCWRSIRGGLNAVHGSSRHIA